MSLSNFNFSKYVHSLFEYKNMTNECYSELMTFLFKLQIKASFLLLCFVFSSLSTRTCLVTHTFLRDYTNTEAQAHTRTQTDTHTWLHFIFLLLGFLLFPPGLDASSWVREREKRKKVREYKMWELKEKLKSIYFKHKAWVTKQLDRNIWKNRE